jgi:hypothetical protein
MKVIYVENSGYYIGCEKTGKFINININGAQKVMSVCDITNPIYLNKDRFEEIRKESKKLKRLVFRKGEI